MQKQGSEEFERHKFTSFGRPTPLADARPTVSFQKQSNDFRQSKQSNNFDETINQRVDELSGVIGDSDKVENFGFNKFAQIQRTETVKAKKRYSDQDPV